MKYILFFILSGILLIGSLNCGKQAVDENSEEVVAEGGEVYVDASPEIPTEAIIPEQKSQENASIAGACKVACGEEFTNSKGEKQCSRSECKQNDSACGNNHECYSGSCIAGKCAACRTMFDCEFYAQCNATNRICLVRK
jgi:hypothetical protein